MFGAGVQGSGVAHAFAVAVAVAPWDLMAGGPPLGFLGTIQHRDSAQCENGKAGGLASAPHASPFFKANRARTTHHFEALRHILDASFGGQVPA